MKLIVIPVDFTVEGALSYFEAKALKNARDFEVLITNSTHLFCFDSYVPSEVDVLLLYKDGSYMMTSEMLSQSFKYCGKQLVKAHNLHKMYRAGVLQPQSPNEYSRRILATLDIIDDTKLFRCPNGAPLIEILVDYTDSSCLSYEESIKSIAANESFKTHEMSFFHYDLLDKGFDVIARRSDGMTCNLRELLANRKGYSDREMRRSHTAWKFIVSGGVNYLPEIE
ncbi:hypothetical protein VCHA53O466_50091 [Vibrio chagasii]|nr:hypothetical protein VCHA53O466_50091 [Vibrio chagasii]